MKTLLTPAELVQNKHLYNRFRTLHELIANDDLMIVDVASYLEQRDWTDVTGIAFTLRERFSRHTTGERFFTAVDLLKFHFGERYKCDLIDVEGERRQAKFVIIDGQHSIGD